MGSDEPSPNLFTTEQGDYRVRLYRRDDLTRKLVYHGTLTLAEAEESWIVERFGGGNYKAQLIDQNNVIREGKEFTLPGPYRPPAGLLPGHRTAEAPQAAATIGTLAPGQVNMSPREMLDSAMFTKLMEVLKAERPPAMDWAGIVVPVIGLIQAIMTRPKEDTTGTAIAQAFERLEARLDAMQKNGPATNAIADAVKAIRELLGVRDMLTPDREGGNEDGAMWNLASKAIEALSGQKPQPQPGMPMLPAETGPAPVMPPGNPALLPDWQRFILANRGQLLGFARRGLDADFCAEMAARLMPPTVNGSVMELLRKPDAANILMQAVPELQQFGTWVQEFVEELRVLMLDDGGEDSDTETTQGDHKEGG